MWILVAVVAALAGAALHFLYDLLPGTLTALISPINESVWEHLKLLFWPMLVAAAYLSQRARNKLRLWGAFFAALLLTPMLLLVSYYTLNRFNATSVAVDIVLYFICMFLGFFIAWLFYRKGTVDRIAGFLLMLVILYGASLILFSFAAPNLPIFQEHSH